MVRRSKIVQKLELGRNLLDTLPEAICNLKSLNRLNLSGNPFKNLPESVENLKSMKELIISGNMIDASETQLEFWERIAFNNN